MKARRKHIKVRTGCQTCRQRRIRCDEARPQCLNCIRRQINCEYSEAESSAAAAARPERPALKRTPTLLAHVDTEVALPNHVKSFLQLPPSETPSFSNEERFLVHHIHEFTEKLEDNNAQFISFGVSLLPEFLRISSSIDYIRDCICGLASMHLSLLNKSSAMIYMGYKYRYRALRGLREALSAPDEYSIDGLLTASFLLSWQAPESNEFLQTMKGIDLALHEMAQRQYVSELRALWQAPAADLPGMTSTSPAAVSLEFACVTLQEFQKQVGANPELVRGVKELYNFVQNLRVVPHGVTPAEQLQAVYPIRWVLPWIPKSIYMLKNKDPLVMLFCAHYNMVAVAMEPFLPAAMNPFAISKRVEFIERVDRMFDDSPQGPVPEGATSDWHSKRTERLHALMFGPLAFAKEYRQRHPSAYWIT